MDIERPLSPQRGMMLLEVMIAILIFAVGVLGVIKMQAVSTANSFNSEDRAIAALIVNDAVAALWAAGTKNPAACGLYGNQPMYSVAAADSAAAQTACNTAAASALNSGTCTVAVSASSYCGNNLNNDATLTIRWNRHLGRNAVATEGATQQVANYTTRVVIQ